MKMTPTKVMILQFNLPLDTSSDGLVATASNLWALCIDIRGETGAIADSCSSTSLISWPSKRAKPPKLLSTFGQLRPS